MTNKIFYLSIISFLSSIFLSSLSINLLYEYLFIFIIIISSFLILLFNNNKNIKKIILLPIIIVISFLLGYVRYSYYINHHYANFDHLLYTQINQNFIIDEEPEKKSFHTKIVAKFINSESRVILWIPNYPTYEYGDLINIKGFLLKPKNFKSKIGRDFDYISYLKKEKIYYEIKPEDLQFIKSNQGNFLKQKLYKIKNIFLDKIKEYIPAPESFLLNGILLGAKEDMGKELLDDFRKTGIIHIVVLSGYNLTLVADFFIKIFAFLGLTVSSIVGSITIILFTLMVGASATIIRASIMALIVIFAKIIGRESEAIKILFLTGFLMVMHSPMILVYDASFQLSFLATLGLITLGKKLEENLTFIPKKFELRGILSATIATQIFVAPLLIYMMGEISIISPIVNILILILVPFTMFLGLWLILMSFFSHIISIFISFLLFILLSYDLFITNFFANLPISILNINLNFIEMFFIYIIFIFMYIWYKNDIIENIIKIIKNKYE